MAWLSSLLPLSRSQNGTLRVEEETAGGHQRHLGSVDLTGAGGAAELVHSFAEMTGAAGGSLAERTAVGVDRDSTVDLDSSAFVVPVLPQERLGPSRRTETTVLEPGERDDREPLVGVEEVDVVDPQVGLALQLLDHHVLAVAMQSVELVFVVLADDPRGGSVDQDGAMGQRPRPFRGGEHERVGAVHREVHVEDV
jgi:hypothetical protein